MSGGLVRGGVGSEIPLSAILPPHLQNVSTRKLAEPLARKYEAEHPGAVVVCDWELIADEDIAVMEPAAKNRALADREFLMQRRTVAKKLTLPPQPARMGEPDRLKEQLARVRGELARLETTHPNYAVLFRDWTNQVHQLEDALGKERTVFKIGYKAALELMPPEKKKALEKQVALYSKQAPVERPATIDAVTDPVLAQFLFDAETDPKLREALGVKIAQIGAAA